MDYEIKEVNRYTINIGLNDADSYKQEVETNRILKLVTFCCKQYRMCFSCTFQTGGYIDENGTYVDENSLALVFIDANSDRVNEIAKDICCFLNQESVLVTVDKIKRYYVSERLKIAPDEIAPEIIK